MHEMQCLIADNVNSTSCEQLTETEKCTRIAGDHQSSVIGLYF